VAAMTTAAIRGNLANRAGKLSNITCPGCPIGKCAPARKHTGGTCQEVDQHLPNARRNTHGSKDSVTKQNAGTNASRRSLAMPAWIRWLNYRNMQPPKLRCSMSTWMTPQVVRIRPLTAQEAARDPRGRTRSWNSQLGITKLLYLETAIAII